MMDDSTTFQDGRIPPWSVNVEDEMCSRANLEKLPGDIFDLSENLLFGLRSNYGSRVN